MSLELPKLFHGRTCPRCNRPVESAGHVVVRVQEWGEALLLEDGVADEMTVTMTCQHTMPATIELEFEYEHG